jgi:hypothetical protein
MERAPSNKSHPRTTCGSRSEKALKREARKR